MSPGAIDHDRYTLARPRRHHPLQVAEVPDLFAIDGEDAIAR